MHANRATAATFVAERRAESASALERGESLLVRDRWPVCYRRMGRYLLVESVEGRLQAKLLGCTEDSEDNTTFLEEGMVELSNVKNFLFLDQEALELALPLLPYGLRLFIAAEAEQGIPGLSLVLARDLERMFWAPVENPTVEQWQEWLGCTTEELVDEIIKFSPKRLRPKHRYKPYLRDSTPRQSFRKFNNSNWVLTHWLPALTWRDMFLTVVDHRTRKSSLEENTSITLDDDNLIVNQVIPDGKHWLLRPSGNASPVLTTKFTVDVLEGRVLRTDLDEKQFWPVKPILIDVPKGNPVLEFNCKSLKTRSAPIDLLLIYY